MRTKRRQRLVLVGLLIANHERDARQFAEEASRRGVNLRIAAEDARTKERVERLKAVRLADLNRRRAIELNVASGVRMLEDGNPAASLP